MWYSRKDYFTWEFAREGTSQGSGYLYNNHYFMSDFRLKTPASDKELESEDLFHKWMREVVSKAKRINHNFWG